MQPRQLDGFQYVPMVNDPYLAIARLQQQKQLAKAAKQPKQQRGRGGTLTSLISELGGAGGAAGGAAIGTALLPGIGTVIGAGLGGFLGGTGGRVAENKVRDNRIGIGDALKEGGLAGALGAVGEGYNLYKGAKAAQAGVEGVGKLTQAGNALRQGVANPKVAASPFGAASEEAITKTLSDLGFKGSAKNQYKQLPNVFAELNGKIDSKLAANTNTSTLSKLVGEVKGNTKALPQFLNGDEAYTKALTSELRDLTGKFGKSKITAAEVQAAKTDLSSKMGNIFTKVAKGSDLNPKEASRLAIWKGLDSHVSTIAPEVKALTSQQSKLYEAAPGLLAKSKETLGIPILGVKSKAAARVTQGGQDLLGQGLQKAGGLADTLGAVAKSPIGRQAGVQALGKPLTMGAPVPQDQPMNPDEQLMQIYEKVSGGAPMQGQQDPQQMGQMGQMGGQQQSPGLYTQENLIADIQRDPKNQDKYLGLYKALSTMNGDSTKPLNATAAGNVTDLQNGIVNLQQLGQQFQDSSSNMPFIGGLLAKNPYNTGAQSLQANVARTKQVIGKALEGGVLRKEDEVKYAKILPTLNDSDAVAQRKIAYIMDDLNRKLALYQQNLGQGGGDYAPQDLQSALAYAQGGY